MKKLYRRDKHGLETYYKEKIYTPHTKVTNFGFDNTIKKIDKAIALLERK